MQNARKLIIPGLDDDVIDLRRHWGTRSEIEPNAIEKIDLLSEDSLRSLAGKKGIKTASLSDVSIVGDSGNLQTCFNILTAFMGGGLLAIPATF